VQASAVNPPAPKETDIDTSSPTVWRRWLARQMRARRLAAGLEQRYVADRLRCTASKVSYCESGDRSFRSRDLSEILLPLYEVPVDEWPRYLEACERSKQKGWWDDYDEDVIADWYRYYVGLEQGASKLRGFAALLIPGLLQTPAYARAVMTDTASGLTSEDAAGRTEVRLHRQDVLTREVEPLAVHYVLDEGVLRRIVGGHEAMGEQLAHLVELVRRPNITLQVLTFEQGYAFDGKGDPLILSFPWPDDAGVVLVEGRNNGQYYEAPHEVDDFARGFDHLQRTALTPVESVTLIENLAKGLQ
jgi:transcriptional regulator with XRE-family HTH domain